MDGKIMNIPDVWIDRIFLRLKALYQDKWDRRYGNPSEKGIYYAMWKNALTGLTSDEIKKAIKICCECKYIYPPTPIEFFHYAKSNIKPPYIKIFPTEKETTPAIANMYLENILKGLGKPKRST